MKNFKIHIVTFASLIFILSSCEKQETIEEPKVSVQEDVFDPSGIQEEQNLFVDNRTNEDLPSLADIALDNGNLMQFYAQEERVSGILVLESGECSGCSALSDLHRITGRQLDPGEIFWALSEKGTEIPEVLNESLLKSENQTELSQGWARTKLSISDNTSAKAADIACNNANFTSSIAGGFLGNPDIIVLDKKPVNNVGGLFINDCYNPGANGQCWGGPRYKLIGQYNGIKKWRGKVCTRNVENIYNTHTVFWCGSGCNIDPNCNLPGSCSIYQGPQISFQYYWNGKWNVMKSGSKTALYNIPANKTRVYSWYWNASQNTSFRLQVRYAKPHDEFDIMMDK